jgi:hypothetical protein
VSTLLTLVVIPVVYSLMARESGIGNREWSPAGGVEPAP